MSTSQRNLEIAFLEALEQVPIYEYVPLPQLPGYSNEAVFAQLMRCIEAGHIGDLSSHVIDPRMVGGIKSPGLRRLNDLRSQRLLARFWRLCQAVAVLVVVGVIERIFAVVIVPWAK
jgi:hypothetical protein